MAMRYSFPWPEIQTSERLAEGRSEAPGPGQQLTLRPLTGLVSLVIPTHNEADNIRGVVAAASATLSAIADSFEIILVDDGSGDGTAGVARQALGPRADLLRVLRHERKSGYGVSVADGLRLADGEYVAFMDGDGQFDATDLRLLVARIGKADLVGGVRVHRADPRFRSIISDVFNVLVRLLYGIDYRDIDCGMKLMRRSLLDAASPLQARSALLNTELFFKAQQLGARVEQVPVPHYPRTAGTRSGARLLPILRAIRELLLLRFRIARTWTPQFHRSPDPS